MVRGDRLHTEEDWMDEAFREAKERYKGPERPSRDLSRPMLMEIGTEGILPPTQFELPEGTH